MSPDLENLIQGRRKFLTGLRGISVAVGSGAGYLKGLTEEYENFTIDNVGETEEVLTYSMDGDVYFIDVHQVRDDSTTTAELDFYREEHDTENMMVSREVKNTGGWIHLENELVSPPEIKVTDIDHRQGTKGSINLKIDSDLNPQMLEPNN